VKIYLLIGVQTASVDHHTKCHTYCRPGKGLIESSTINGIIYNQLLEKP